MKSTERRRLDRLLSGGPGPSVQERETLLRSVLTRSVPATQKDRNFLLRRWVWAPATAILAGVILTLALFNWPGQPLPAGDPEFSTRGGTPADGSIRLACTGSSPGKTPPASPTLECHPGDTLVFGVSPGVGNRYFSAAALGPEGLLVWYFPSETSGSLPLDQVGVADRGIILGAEHPPGDYRLFGLFTEIAVAQADLRAAIEEHLAGKVGSRPIISASFQVVRR